MNRIKQRLLTFMISAALVIGIFPAIPAIADTDDSTSSGESVYVLYTNDIHCEVSGYPALAAYRAQLLENGENVVTVDAGDAIQGEAIGAQTKGSAIIDIMNTVGYDYAIPGNHEFDYSLSTFLDLTKNADFTYLSANFVDLQTGSIVFTPYAVKDFDGKKAAFIGICTPETYTKSTPVYFQDENGNYLYSFSENTFYETIQNTIDQAREDGADIVIAVGHLGINGTASGWKSTDVIANTTGIDVFIDGHSHETIANHIYQNKDGEDVPLTSTGTKFDNFGIMKIQMDASDASNDISITAQLLHPSEVTYDSSEAASEAYHSVQNKIDHYNQELSYLYEVLGTAETELTINNAEGVRRIRSGETNLGDFVADAYRSICQADIALVNGGGIRASVSAGDVTRKSLMDVNPWSNAMCVIEASGQQILDALEHGARNLPEENGGFLQVSGLTYDIDTWKESPVIMDEQGTFQSIDPAKERRITNVKVNGQALEPDKMYTVCGSVYTLQNSGDGFTMFKNDKVVAQDNLPTDATMLISYFTDVLNGRITAGQYGNIAGEGRIIIHTDASQHPEDDKKEDSGKETEVPETQEPESETTPETESESETKETEKVTPSDQNNKKPTPTTSKKTASSAKTAKKAVKTGDSTPVEPLAVTALASVAVIIIITAKKKKRL